MEGTQDFIKGFEGLVAALIAYKLIRLGFVWNSYDNYFDSSSYDSALFHWH